MIYVSAHGGRVETGSHKGEYVASLTLDEDTANRYAQEIKVALEYIVRTLRRTQEERKAYASSVKEIRKLPIK